MAKHEYENKGPVYLTYAKYEEYRVAGTLEVGREYRIINSEELFDCTYDTTTYAEITEAITNLRLPVCTYGGRKYYYVSESNNTYEFSCCAGSKMYQITVTSGNVWSNAEASSGNITSRDATEGESIPLLELGTKVIANPEIPSGTEATQLNALKIGEGYYAPTKVEANPTLSGSETELSGIEIGGTKYKMASGGGGSALYRHYITLVYTGSKQCYGLITTNYSTAFTLTTLKTFMKNNKILPLCGSYYTNNTYYSIEYLEGNYAGTELKIYCSNSTYIESIINLYDKVTDMEGNLV